MAYLYVDDTLVRDFTTSMGYVNVGSGTAFEIEVTGLGNAFNTSYYKRIGVSYGPLSSDGTSTAPSNIVYSEYATSSGTSTTVSFNVSKSTLSGYLSYSGEFSVYVWAQAYNGNYYYLNSSVVGFCFTNWYKGAEYSVTSYDKSYHSMTGRSLFEYILVNFKSPADAVYFFHINSSSDVVLNYLGTGSSSSPYNSFDINKLGKVTNYSDKTSSGIETYQFAASQNSYHWFAITGYNGTSISSPSYNVFRSWTKISHSSDVFNGIEGTVSSDFVLGVYRTTRIVVKPNVAGTVSISVTGTSNMIYITSSDGTIDGETGFYTNNVVTYDTSSGSSSVSFTASAGTTYYLWVRTYTYGAYGDITVTVTAPTSANVRIADGSDYDNKYYVYICTNGSYIKYKPYVCINNSWVEV